LVVSDDDDGWMLVIPVRVVFMKAPGITLRQLAKQSISSFFLPAY
jgi:hypothetical protein